MHAMCTQNLHPLHLRFVLHKSTSFTLSNPHKYSLYDSKNFCKHLKYLYLSHETPFLNRFTNDYRLFTFKKSLHHPPLEIVH